MQTAQVAMGSPVDTAAAETNCDPKVVALKNKCDELKTSDLQKQYLRNELSQVKATKAAEVVVYVHLQELFKAIPQAFGPMADGKTTAIQPVSQH